MELLRPNTTAQRTAMKRAAHQLLDDPKVFEDPLALRIIGKEYRSALLAEPGRFEEGPFSPYLRAFIAARSRYAEDELADGILRGVCQYVVLGAGLDTFAYRNPYSPRDLCVFEVDHPEVQAWKRKRLDEASIAVPENLRFVSVDFERQILVEGLLDAGYDPGKRTFFSWLGVTEYLMAEAVEKTLRFVASAPPGSEIVFDYILSPSLLTHAQRARFDAIAKRVASAGEPWQTFFDPAVLTRDLFAMGFSFVEDRGPDEINRKYFRDRKDGLRVGSLSHIMTARV